MFPRSLFYSNNPEMFFQHARYAPESTSMGIFCVEGKMHFKLNGESISLESNQLALIPPRYVVDSVSYNRDGRFHFLSVSGEARSEIIHYCMREDARWWEKDKYMHSNPIFNLSNAQSHLCDMYGTILSIYCEQDEETDERAVQAMLKALVLDLMKWTDKMVPTFPDFRAQGRVDVLFRRFLLLVQKHGNKKREVQWYAEHLAITPKYLTTVCHAISGQTASSIINEALVQEIKRLLIQTDMSSKEICEQMEFVTPSFFCKYVKRELGMNVKAYRRAYRK